MGKPFMERIGKLAITGAGAQGRIWKFAQNGNYLYAAASSDGIYTFNITDPEAPTLEGITPFYESTGPLTEFEGEATDILVSGTDLFVCGRAINFTTPAPGILSKYDISGGNASSPSYTSTYTFPSRTFYVVRGKGEVWPQGIVSDGTYVYAACQYDGLYVVNQSTMAFVGRHGMQELGDDSNFYAERGTHDGGDSSFLIDTTASFPVGGYNNYTVINLTKRHLAQVVGAFQNATNVGATMIEPSSGYVAADLGTALWENGDEYAIVPAYTYWEASNIAKKDSWVYLSQHGNGVFAVDVTTPASPTSATQIDVPTGLGVQLRPRNVMIDRDYLYAVPNTTTGDEPERGLMVAEIPANPATMTAADWTVYSIGETYNDTWVGSGIGDRPLMGFGQYKNLVYVANGQTGIAIYDVMDQENVVLEGVQQKSNTGTANLYTVYPFESGGNIYAYYGDAFQSASLQEHNLYYDRVYPEGKKVFTIGNHGSVSTSSIFVLDTYAVTPNISTLTHTASAGDVVEKYTIRVQDSSGAKDWEVALYEVSGGVPTNLVPGSQVTITNSGTTGTTWRTLESGTLSIGLTAGVEYIVAVTNSTGTAGAGNPKIAYDGAGIPGRRDSNVTGGAFNNPWQDTVGINNAAVSAVGRNISAGGSVTGTVTDTIL
jgi:hypothetical protein